MKAEGVAVELLTAYRRPQSELVYFYNAADVMVLPSFWKGHQTS